MIKICINLCLAREEDDHSLVYGMVDTSAGAEDSYDQEANCCRLAENMVREAFRRLRIELEKQHGK